jgi:tryptophan synthase alpha chain
MTNTRIERLFAESNGKKILNVYCTAGFPKQDSTLEVIAALQNAGAHLVELGMPYSDPLADGPVIQQSSMQALANGMTMQLLFEQLKDFRKTIHLPVVLMGYLNPVLQYGFEKFCQDAAAVGVDGLILPDMPIIEFENNYGAIIEKYGLNFIFLVTPETSEERVRLLDNLSSGFLYAVSSSSTTGSAGALDGVDTYLQKLSDLQLKNPLLAGFGIHDKAGFDRVCQYVAGGIIGSAYIKALQGGEDVAGTTSRFIKSILG